MDKIFVWRSAKYYYNRWQDAEATLRTYINFVEKRERKYANIARELEATKLKLKNVQKEVRHITVTPISLIPQKKELATKGGAYSPPGERAKGLKFKVAEKKRRV